MPATITVHKNVETTRRGYQAFNSGDMAALTELFHEQASWHVPGHSPMAGDFVGRDAVFAYFGRLAQETGGTLRAVLEHLCADEEGRVVAIQRDTAQRGSRHLDISTCIVFEFKDGRVVSGTEYPYDLHAIEAFWS
jgi:ketosteroid isomerase-like protein